MLICSMPGCQTTAGCKCQPQPFRLYRRRETVLASEVMEWLRNRPGASWKATEKDINEALDNICGT